jgi:hypothetical protein
MAPDVLTENPFGVLTFIAAPALLTNASSVLAMSTINRMLRTRDRMHEIYLQADDPVRCSRPEFVRQANRVENQALLLLNALRWIYTALASFAGATLVTLLGAVADQFGHLLSMRVVVSVGFLLGVAGVTGLVGGCITLFRATQLSLAGIREEADAIRLRQSQHSR